MAEKTRAKYKGGTIMKLNDEKKTQAEYDRFVDFMAHMYLKYGTKYRVATAEDIIKMFPKRHSKKKSLPRKYRRKGA